MRANSNWSFPMPVSSRLFVVLGVTSAVLPRDRDLDLRLALLLARLDLQRQVVVREDRDLLVAHREGEGPRANAVCDAGESVRRLGRRRRPLEFELVTASHSLLLLRLRRG